MAELDAFWTLIPEVLRLEAGTVDVLSRHPSGGQLALIVVLLAGLSEALGESVVLFINRISPRRFILSLFISALLFAFAYAFWTLSIYLVARYAFGSPAGFGLIARVVGFAYAPRLFGFLAFVPFFGVPISILLQLWSTAAMLVGVNAALELGVLPSLASVLLGGLLMVTMERTVGRPIIALARWVRHRVAGVELVTDRRSLRALVDAGPDRGLLPANYSEKLRFPRREAQK